MALGACVRSDAVQCDFGLCAAGSRCDETNQKCIPRDCGNGKLDNDEQCDSSTGASDCTDFGFYYAPGLACSPECTFDTSMCTGTCGDHTVDPAEQCDGLPPAGELCSDFGFDYGRIACTPLCGPRFDACGTIGWRVGLGTAQDALYAIWGVRTGTTTDLFTVGGTGGILHSDGGYWNPMVSNTKQQLTGVWGSARDDVYAVGSNPSFMAGDGGIVLHYDGAAWTQVASLPTAHNLRAVWGRSGSDIYAVGDLGTVIHFDGATWSNVMPAPPAPSQLLGVWGSDTDMYVVGTTGTVPVAYKLSAGSWQAITVTAPATALTAVWGHGPNVFATGDTGTVITAALADTAWALPANLPALAPDLTAVWGTSETDVYFVGARGLIVHFDGKRYEVIDNDAVRSNTGVIGLTPRELYAATRSGVVISNAGTQWTQPQLIADPTQRFHAIVADASGHVVAGGFGGMVVDSDPTNPTGWAPATTILPSGNTQPNILSMWASSDGTVFFAASGATGGLFHRAAGSTTIVQDVVSGQIQAVAGSSKMSVWAVGGNSSTGAVRHWNGTAWSLVTTIPAGTPKLTGVWVSPSDELFAAALGGSVIHSTDSGATWTTMTTGLVPADPSGAFSIGGAAANDLYVGGLSALLAHYDGSAWRVLHLPSFPSLLSFLSVSASDVYAFGTGTMFHYDGTSWVGILQPGTFAPTAGVLVGDELVVAGDLGQAISLRIPPAPERACTDGFDDDRNGLTDCADPACTGDPACTRGGSCPQAAQLTCETSMLATSTYSGISRIDDLPCLDHSTPGPEIAWDFAPGDGVVRDVTVTIAPTAATPRLDLVAMPAYATGACALPKCTAATSNAVTFHYDGTNPYYILVDTDDFAHAADFTISVSCL
jgi:hypothetical protein